MTVQEVMDRTGSRNTNLVIAYIKDALDEIQERSADKRSRQLYDIVDGTRLYNFPSDFVRLLAVYKKYDSNGRYVRIPEVTNVDIIEDSTASTTTSDDDVIISL